MMNKRYLYFNTLLISLLIILTLYWRVYFTIPFIFSYIAYYILKYQRSAMVLVLILLGSFLFNFKGDSVIISTEYEHTAVVNNVYSSSITVIEDGQEYYLMKVEDNVVKGDVIHYYTYYYTDVDKGSFGLFYKSTEAIAYGYATDLEVVKKQEDVRSDIYNDLYESESWYSDLTLLLLYGEEEGKGVALKSKIDKMGVSHLFVVSGFHISLFYILIEKTGNSFIRNRKLVSLSAFTISMAFLYLVYFPPTGIRALITLLIIRSARVDKVEALSITGLIFFLFNPWILLTNSMILSFSITYAIYVYRPSDVSILDMVVLSLFAFYVSLPTISTWETQHNLFAPLLSLVLTPIVSIMYMISLVLLPFKNVWDIVDPIFSLFYWMIIIFSHINLTFDTALISQSKQLLLTGISIYYIYLLRYNKLTILYTFFSISMIIFLI